MHGKNSTAKHWNAGGAQFKGSKKNRTHDQVASNLLAGPRRWGRQTDTASVLTAGGADLLREVDQRGHAIALRADDDIGYSDSSIAAAAHVRSVSNVQCFMEVEIGGNKTGRIVVELFSDIAPRAAENFRVLCTGKKTFQSPEMSSSLKLHFKGCSFHRVIPGFMVQVRVQYRKSTTMTQFRTCTINTMPYTEQ